MNKQQLIDKINALKADDQYYIERNREIAKEVATVNVKKIELISKLTKRYNGMIKQLRLNRKDNLSIRRDIEKEIKHCAYLIKSGNYSNTGG